MLLTPCPLCGVFRGERCVRVRGEKGGRAGTWREHPHRERKAAAREVLRAARRKNPARRSVNDQVQFGRRWVFNFVTERRVEPTPIKSHPSPASNLKRLKREAAQGR